MPKYDIVLRGGRVVDPASGLDATRNVGLARGSVAAVAEDDIGIEGSVVVDAADLVVAPGFIDLHSHAQTLAGRRLQVCDGVTAAFDLEAGRARATDAYAREAQGGSPIHYGFASSWAAARDNVMTGAIADGGMGSALSVLGTTAWRAPATGAQLSSLLHQLAEDLAEGAIGVGVLLGYAPEVDPREYLAVARLARQFDVPTFTHCRDLSEVAQEGKVDGAEELVRTAGESGAHIHYCHVNSSSGRYVDRVLGLVERCRAEGAVVSTEAYPYGSGATAIGAPFLSFERLRARGLGPSALTYLPTLERVSTRERLEELRAHDPGGLVIVDFLNEAEPADRAALLRSLSFEGSAVASDAMPLTPFVADFDPLHWPLTSGATTHPRSAGCFARVLRLWREQGWPLIDAVRRCTIFPARALERACPQMRLKGRVQIGSDADLVVFDPGRVTDQATYTESTRTSSGIRHVVVGGEFVVRDGELLLGALPGKPVRAGGRAT